MSYALDKAYRLTGVPHPTSPNEQFNYDKVGNRLTTQDSPTPWTYADSDYLSARRRQFSTRAKSVIPLALIDQG